MSKLWHDDIRPAPDGWEWCKDNRAAKKLLRTGSVTEISLDHDLGTESTGYNLVRWMVRHKCVPEQVTIHSFNPVGAKRMKDHLEAAGHRPQMLPRRPY